MGRLGPKFCRSRSLDTHPCARMGLIGSGGQQPLEAAVFGAGLFGFEVKLTLSGTGLVGIQEG